MSEQSEAVSLLISTKADLKGVTDYKRALQEAREELKKNGIQNEQTGRTVAALEKELKTVNRALLDGKSNLQQAANSNRELGMMLRSARSEIPFMTQAFYLLRQPLTAITIGLGAVYQGLKSLFDKMRESRKEAEEFSKTLNSFASYRSLAIDAAKDSEEFALKLKHIEEESHNAEAALRVMNETLERQHALLNQRTKEREATEKTEIAAQLETHKITPVEAGRLTDQSTLSILSETQANAEIKLRQELKAKQDTRNRIAAEKADTDQKRQAALEEETELRMVAGHDFRRVEAIKKRTEDRIKKIGALPRRQDIEETTGEVPFLRDFTALLNEKEQLERDLKTQEDDLKETVNKAHSQIEKRKKLEADREKADAHLNNLDAEILKGKADIATQLIEHRSAFSTEAKNLALARAAHETHEREQANKTLPELTKKINEGLSKGIIPTPEELREFHEMQEILKQTTPGAKPPSASAPYYIPPYPKYFLPGGGPGTAPELAPKVQAAGDKTSAALDNLGVSMIGALADVTEQVNTLAGQIDEMRGQIKANRVDI